MQKGEQGCLRLMKGKPLEKHEWGSLVLLSHDPSDDWSEVCCGETQRSLSPCLDQFQWERLTTLTQGPGLSSLTTERRSRPRRFLRRTAVTCFFIKSFF